MPNTVGEYMGLKKKKNGSWSKSGDPMRTRAATDDYREGMERMGMGDALERYCAGCGRLPHFCECEPNAIRCVAADPQRGTVTLERYYNPNLGPDGMIDLGRYVIKPAESDAARRRSSRRSGYKRIRQP